MPPKCTRVKNSGTAKENVRVTVTAKSKNVPKNSKGLRKALSDKTNSVSDDNISLTSPKFVTQTRKAANTIIDSYKCEDKNEVQTRRKRKLPERFVENEILMKLSRSKDHEDNNKNPITNQKMPVIVLTPLKTLDKVVEKSIADCRPKRICRLPSKFDDHSISPNKYVPVQPIQASTPIPQNRGSKIISTKGQIMNKERVIGNRNLSRPQMVKKNKKNLIEDKTIINNNKKDTSIDDSKAKKVSPLTSLKSKNGLKKKQKDNIETNTVLNKAADTNNNANELPKDKSPYKKASPRNISKIVKHNRILEKEYSFKVFDTKKKPTKRDASSLDVYEFTYDPTEEPPPQKKKRKRTVRKKQEKQKPVFTNNYNKNVAKSLALLKNVLSAKTSPNKKQPETVMKQTKCVDAAKTNEFGDKNKMENASLQPNYNLKSQVSNSEQNVTQKNYNSFHVEDIIVNQESYDHNDMNYSPVNSPRNVNLPSEPINDNSQLQKNSDPLNLQDNLSFFDENPAASSSLNVSARNPNATPWRVEFGQLPIKWQANTYVKPNMTPAFESSFIVDDKKKHVYTNIVSNDNEQLPEIVENDNTSKLMQTSIISFFREVAEKSANKKLKTKSSPVKRNTIFEDISNISHNVNATPEKQMSMKLAKESVTPKKNKSLENSTSSTDNVSSSDKENVIASDKKKDKDVTYFGFDESEEIDQENVIPNKKLEKQRRRALRPRSRAILQELNGQKETPVTPIDVSTNINKNAKSNENEIFNDMTGKDAQCIPEKTMDCIPEITNHINNGENNNFSQDDSQSVHLFEDLEVIHHLKPPRKSYTKQKRVAFRKNSVSSDSLESDAAVEQGSSSAEEDDLQDLTFQMPSMQPKKTRTKKKSKKQLSKKEEKEVEAWAAGFNSMCEDIDEFDLVVE